MSTAYTLANGFAVAFGFFFSVIGLVKLMIGSSGELLLIISLLILLIGLHGWQYIQTLVRLDEMADEIKKLKDEKN